MNREIRNRAKLTSLNREHQPAIDLSTKYIKYVQIQLPQHKPDLTSKSKSRSNHKKSQSNKQKPSKARLIKTNPHESSDKSIKGLVYRPKITVSQDKQNVREKQFKRKNNKRNDERISKSKKDSKRSTDNQNQETLVERLRAQNQFYRKAYLSSKQNLDKLEKAFHQEKVRRSHEKQWFRSQIDGLKKKLSVDKIQLCHIFTFEAFENQQISNMIVETENQSSSLMVHNRETPPMQEDFNEHLSDLSIESK